MEVWSLMGWVVWPILMTVLGNWKNRVTIFFPLCFLLVSLAPSLSSLFIFLLLPHCPKGFQTILFLSRDGNLLFCSLCGFFVVVFLSFWSDISQPVLLSWNRREPSCSKHEQESHRWQNSGNASIFWADSDWKAGLKHAGDHEDTQVWGSWCGSVWLHSPWVEEIQPHIQVILLSTYFPPVPRNRNIISKEQK